MRRRQFAAWSAAGATSLALPRHSVGQQPGNQAEGVFAVTITAFVTPSIGPRPKRA
jgi:hypothetical protein